MFKIGQLILNNIKSNKSLRYDICLKSTIAEAKINEIQEEALKPKPVLKPQNSMVASVFASLNEIPTPATDEKISKAADVNELLSISQGHGISRQHALKVVSTLAEWSTSGKTKLSEFENDSRFIKLCRILSKGTKVNRHVVPRSHDLNAVLTVTADDEAARLVNNLSMQQMIKVMSTLVVRKRRSVLLLRALAFNISASNETLNLKESADLLYSMCNLSFVDDNLLAKICNDVTTEMRKDFKKSSVVGSIVTSLGLLKYKNCEILDCFTDWFLQNPAISRPQDMFSLFVTLAMVNYIPSNSEKLFNVMLPELSLNETRKPVEWLDLVWALVILNQASEIHISSVLHPHFLRKIEGANTWANIKLLNINAAAKYLIQGYNGPTLPPVSNIHKVKIIKTRENREMIENIITTLKNLIQSKDHLNVEVNTGWGFSIDAECLLDKKCNPQPVNKSSSEGDDLTKVAILAHDYHNMCIGKVEPTGPNVLNSRLLEACGYKVLAVPYTEFKTTDKLVHRVQYLENRLKNIVK